MIKRNFLILLIAILGFSNAELFAMTQDDSSGKNGLNKFVLPDDPNEPVTPQMMLEVTRYITSIFGFIPESNLSSMTIEQIVHFIDSSLDLTPKVSESTFPMDLISYQYENVEKLYILDRKVDIASFTYSPDKDLIYWNYYLKLEDKEEIRTFLRILLRCFIAMGYDPTIGRHLSFTTQPEATEEGYMRTVNCSYTDLNPDSLMAIISVTLRKAP